MVLKVKNGPPYRLDRGRKQTRTGFKKHKGPGWSYSSDPGETSDKHYIKKGTKMYRVSSVDKENNIGETYVTYNPLDRAFYKAYIYSKNPGANVYEQTFKTKEDLVVPSQKELAEVQKKVILDNPKLKKLSQEGFSNFRSFGEYQKEKIDKMAKDHDEITSKIKSIVPKNGTANVQFAVVKKNNEMRIAAMADNDPKKTVDLGKYDNSTITKVNNFYRYGQGKVLKKQILDDIKNEKISSFSYVSLSMGTSKELKSAMIKELKKRGYNAMVDEAGVGALEVPGINDKKSGRVTREGVEPIIVFDRAQSLRPKGKSRLVTSSDYIYGMYNYNRWRETKDHAYRKITW